MNINNQYNIIKLINIKCNYIIIIISYYIFQQNKELYPLIIFNINQRKIKIFLYYVRKF